MVWKTKISESNITFGPQTTDQLDELVVTTLAHELYNKGYIGVSNAYCCVKRVDRDDWIDVLAKKMNTCRADYYNVDGSGISRRWREHYITVYSNDELTINPFIYRKLKAYYQ